MKILTKKLRFVTKNVKLVPVISYHLPSGQEMNREDDPQSHNRAIWKFYGQVRNTIEQFRESVNSGKPLENSEYHSVILEELKHLASASYDKKMLLVFSDLFEKSFLNVYAQTDLTPVKLAAIFEKEELLPKRLDGIEVVFVFSSKNREEDKRFTLTADAYKKLLVEHGAIVSVQADAVFVK